MTLERVVRAAPPGGHPATAVLGVGALDALPEALGGAARVLLITGRRSFCASGAEQALAPLLAGRVVVRGEPVPASTPLAVAEAALVLARSAAPDVVLAVGGGSVLDAAKVVAALAPGAGCVAEAVARGRPLPLGLPTIAVPTTAGSGAEASSGAVLWSEGVKLGLDGPGLRPIYALVDPRLSASMDGALAATTGLDALCQATESLWAVAASEASRVFARRALSLILGALPGSVAGDAEARATMARAAFLSGCAIDLTRTTAAHAVSYALTSRWGVPHGHAVALTLGAFLLFNAGVGVHDCNHPGGPAAVRAAMGEVLALLGVSNAADGRAAMEGLVARLGLACRLRDVGVGAQDLDMLVASANPIRLRNNPRRLDVSSLRDVLESAW